MSVMLLNEDIIKIIACKGFNHPEEILKLKFPSEPGFPNYEIIKERKPVSVVNISQEFPKFAQPGEPFVKGEIKSWLGVPMTNMKDVIGMFAIDRLEEKPFSEEDVEIAMQYANRAAIAITNAQLFERRPTQIEKLEILRRIDATITISTDLDDALKAILSEVKNGLKVDVASVFLYQEEDKTLNFAQSVGYKTKGHPKTKVNIGQGYMGTVAKSEAPLFIPVVDLSDDGYRYPFNMKKEGIVSYYGFHWFQKVKCRASSRF